MAGGNQLLAFLAILASHGLEPDALDPWRGWLAFKEYVRAATDHRDPGVSIQVTVDPWRNTRLYLVRQVADPESEELTPVGAVICDFHFVNREPPAEREFWTLDYSDFERFVNVVEQDPIVAALFLEQPGASDIYWEEA